MRALLAGLFPPGVAVAAAGPADADPAALLPEEAERLGPMAPVRRAEYVAGRVAARRALAALGVAPVAIGTVPGGRDPRWPEGIVGSIAHTGGLAAAACGRAEALAGLGLDLEGAGPLPPETVATICRPDELAALAALPPPSPSDWPKLLFAAKEAAYKAWFPRARVPLGFHEMSIDVDASGRAFRARVRAAAPGGAVALEGRLAWDGGLVAAGAVALRR
jgi:4'-phosphopantetheinyl transferase EntD